MTNKSSKYGQTKCIFTSHGFRRVPTPIFPNLKIHGQMEVQNIKELKKHQSSAVNILNRSSSSHHPTSYLDRQWLYNLENMKLLEKPKSVPPCSPTVSSQYSQTSHQQTQRTDNHPPPCESNESDVRSNNFAYDKCYTKRLVQPHITCNSVKLNHQDLTNGQKRYLWDTARCYSVQQLKELTQLRMKCVLDYEFMKRYITKSIPDDVKVNLWKEYCDYRIQIDKSVKTNPRCSSCSYTRLKSRRSSLVGNSVSTSDGNKSNVPAVIVTKEAEDKSILNANQDTEVGSRNQDLFASNGLGAEIITKSEEKCILNNDTNIDCGAKDVFGASEEIGREIPRRVRPKSAKYQKRTTTTNSIQTGELYHRNYVSQPFSTI